MSGERATFPGYNFPCVSALSQSSRKGLAASACSHFTFLVVSAADTSFYYECSGDRLFSRDCCDRTSGNGFELKEGRFRLDIRQNFFMMRVVKHWHGFPREVVDAQSLETFKVRLDGALTHLI